jgi:hypothetical protein
MWLLFFGLLAAPAEFGAETNAVAPDSPPVTAVSNPSASLPDASGAPEGLLDMPFLRAHRAVGLLASGVGLAGGMTLSAFGVYGLIQDAPSGFADSSVQGEVLAVASGFVLSSLFSYCLNALLPVQ